MSVAEIFKTMAYGPAPEAPDAVYAWLDAHNRKFDLFINNQWVAPKEGKYFESHSPATEEALAQVASAGKDDIDEAVSAARKAFTTWSKTPGHVRARYVYAIARSIQKHARLFAVLESLDNGKPIRESRDIDIPLVIRHFYHHAGWAQLMETELRDYQPVGVVGQIIPWNFPMLMLAWKIAPAISMGNTVVIKPATYTPLTALLFAEVCAEAGLPPGVVNVITGNQAGRMIVEHPDLDKLAFTGSTAVGRTLRRATAGTGKRLSLELGGKSPYVVFDDADQDAAIEGLVDAIWFNQGQVCCAGSRLLVQENIADHFIDKLKLRMSKLRVGHPLDKSIDIGAVVDRTQQQTIDEWVQIGIKEGAHVFQPDIPLPEKGCWYMPTLITNVNPASMVVQEEIFGPVLVAMTFRTPKEAVALANNTRYGLAASVWSDNVNLAIDVAKQIKAGSVWVNCTNLFDGASGFGGYRESGFGREGGKEGLFEYVRPKWQNRPRPEMVSSEKKWGAFIPAFPKPLNGSPVTNGALGKIDRTAKMYIGGAQKRPDGNYSREIYNPDGKLVGLVSDGNRKDIRDAVEAAQKASGWGSKNGHTKAQILYYIAENLHARHEEFVARLVAMTGAKAEEAKAEVDRSIERLFLYAAWADKYGGTVQDTTLRGLVVGVNEPIGVIGIACPDESPLLAFVSLFAPAVAMGNTIVIIPSEKYPLSATDFYQVFDTSDLPGGVVNIVTGDRDALSKTLVEHDDVDAMWYFGSAEGSCYVEQLSAENMKRTWVGYGIAHNWADAHQGAGEEFLREATQVKNIWVPSGE